MEGNISNGLIESQDRETVELRNEEMKTSVISGEKRQAGNC
jgi:hypothetical protein